MGHLETLCQKDNSLVETFGLFVCSEIQSCTISKALVSPQATDYAPVEQLGMPYTYF